MTRYLLDANALIALTIADHVHFDRASMWFASVTHAALCPVVEGALVRYLVRVGVAVATVQPLLRALHDDPRLDFWADDLSYADVDLTHVVGHQQVTDSYLVALAVAHGGRLATFDRGLAEALPEGAFLIPDPGGGSPRVARGLSR